MTKVAIDLIRVDSRQRKDLGNINELAQSIKEYGLLHPVVVVCDEDGSYTLVAGERRLTACTRLGWTEIPVTVFQSKSELVTRSMELEENIKRKDLNIAEQARAVRDLEELKQSIYGSNKKGGQPALYKEKTGFSRADTAKLLNRSVGSVTMDIQIAEALEFFPDLAVHTNKTQILKEFKRRKEAMILSVLAEKDAKEAGPSTLDSEFLCEDAKQWLPEQEAGIFDLIISDPPWGIGIEDSHRANTGGRIGKEYADDEKSAFELMDVLIPECYRLLRENRHMYFFFGVQFYTEILARLTAVGFTVDPIPGIWNKTHFTGAPTGNTWPHQYETYFFCQKGNRKLDLKSGGNVRSHPVVIPSERVHNAQKPIGLIKDFISASTVPNELVFDPTGGSGVALLAAKELGRRGLVLENDPDIYNKAKDNIKQILAKPVLPNLMDPNYKKPDVSARTPLCEICGKGGSGMLHIVNDTGGYDHVHDGECYTIYSTLKDLKGLETT